MNLSFREKIIYGSILLGVGFPIMGIAISLGDLELSFSFENLIIVHHEAPANYLIDLAPLVLPSVAWLVTHLAKNETEKAVDEDENKKVKRISNIIDELKNENFDVNCEFEANLKHVGDSLNQLKTSLSDNKTEEQLRFWETKGIEKFSEILRNNNDDIEELSQIIIKELAKYIGVQFGGVFILDDSRKVHKLNLTAAYAYDKKTTKTSFEIGEGLVGQCYKNQKMSRFDEIPEEYTYNIESGFGNSSPTSLIFCPLISNNVCIGVIELASLKVIEEYKADFIKNISESIATSIINVKNGQQTKDLLEESQFMSQQLQAQEEELRQNAEELQATQEEIERKLSETENILSVERKKINSIINSSSDGIIVVSEKGKLKDYNPAFKELFGYTKTDLSKISLHKILNTEDQILEFIESNLGGIIEHEIKTKTDELIWVKLSINKMEIPNEINYSIFISDISELKHNANAMEESLMEFQNMMMEQSEEQGKLEMEMENLKEELQKHKKN